MEHESSYHDETTGANPSRIVTRALDSFRRKIRVYVFWQGLLFALIWLALSFWLVFLLDYLPVLFGFSELSQSLRIALLTVTGLVFAFIVYRWVLQRIRKPLDSASLALLLERRFPQFNDALITVVQEPQLTRSKDQIEPTEVGRSKSIRHHRVMLDESRSHAEGILKQISIKQVFNLRPLMAPVLIVCLLTISVFGFASLQQSTFLTALRRVYLLDPSPWPRQCHLEMMGIKVKYPEVIPGIPDMSATRGFSDQRRSVARNASVSLLIRAEMPTSSDPTRRLPRRCEFLFRTADGQRGRLPLRKVGGTSDGFQNYSLEGEILDRVSDDIEFYVRGDDHTIGPFTLAAVDAPSVTRTDLDCQYPDYLIDVASSRFTARQIPYTPGIKLPMGTRADMQVQFDAPVSQAFLLSSDNQLLGQPDCVDGICTIDLPKVETSQDFRLVVQGAEGQFSPSPISFSLAAEKDLAPEISSQLRGIGTAVTPAARIPVVSEISDQHGVQKAWIELQTPLTDAIELEQPAKEGLWESEVDLRQIRSTGEIPGDLPTDPPSEIVLTVVAKDFYDLEGKQNVGAGTRHPLEVVSADKLLRILEREEAGQRFRLEQIYQEMSDARDFIARSRRTQARSDEASEPGDTAVSGQSPGDSLKEWELRQLFIQRAVLQVKKSRQELAGVAYSFADIRLQLIHNRIDAEDRKKRLQEDVALPLEKITEYSMADLESQLVLIERKMKSLLAETQGIGESILFPQPLDQSLLEALASAEDVLAKIQQVLNSLLKFETQNELLDLVRQMLDQQKELKRRTEAIRNRDAFDDIFKN